MTAHSKIIVEKFCGLCNWAYDAWRTHRILFDDNPRKEDLQRSRSGKALERISIMTQEYLLHQISKLHDPAVQQGQINLGVDYMVRFGGWDAATRERLQSLQSQLNELANKIKSARNKVLSHNERQP